MLLLSLVTSHAAVSLTLENNVTTVKSELNTQSSVAEEKALSNKHSTVHINHNELNQLWAKVAVAEFQLKQINENSTSENIKNELDILKVDVSSLRKEIIYLESAYKSKYTEQDDRIDDLNTYFSYISIVAALLAISITGTAFILGWSAKNTAIKESENAVNNWLNENAQNKVDKLIDMHADDIVKFNKNGKNAITTFEKLHLEMESRVQEYSDIVIDINNHIIESKSLENRLHEIKSTIQNEVKDELGKTVKSMVEHEFDNFRAPIVERNRYSDNDLLERGIHHAKKGEVNLAIHNWYSLYSNQNSSKIKRSQAALNIFLTKIDNQDNYDYSTIIETYNSFIEEFSDDSYELVFVNVIKMKWGLQCYFAIREEFEKAITSGEEVINEIKDSKELVFQEILLNTKINQALSYSELSQKTKALEIIENIYETQQDNNEASIKNIVSDALRLSVEIYSDIASKEELLIYINKCELYPHNSNRNIVLLKYYLFCCKDINLEQWLELTKGIDTNNFNFTFEREPGLKYIHKYNDEYERQRKYLKKHLEGKINRAKMLDDLMKI